MKKLLILAALVTGLAGMARSQDQGLFNEMEKGRMKYDGITAQKPSGSGPVDASAASLGSILSEAKALKQAHRAAPLKKELPPRLTENSPLPHSDKPAEGPKKGWGAFVLGVCVGALWLLFSRPSYSGGGGSSGE